MRLNFSDKLKVANALAEMIEQDGSFVRYRDHDTEANAAKALSDRLGLDVSTPMLAGMRTELHGKLRAFRHPSSEATAEIEDLRNIIAGLTNKVENLRKVVEHFDMVQHKRRADMSAKLREIIGHKRVDERSVKTQMRGAGYSDDEIAMGLFLTGATVQRNGDGSTIEIRP